MSPRTVSEAYRLSQPVCRDTPVVFSSPHSGRLYPPAFLDATALDARLIRSSEDAFVDDLFASAPAQGAPLIAAQLPRAFLDLNRACDELDPALIEGIVRAPHNPRISSGLGVIPRVVSQGRPIYRGKIPLAEAEMRLRHYWHPYHDALMRLLQESHRAFGQAVLIDCHSMPHEAIEGHARPGVPHPEVVLGDRFGAAAGREVVERIEAAFRAAGLRVVRNAPFAGAYITQAYGRPSRRQHVVQIEIDRALYMDEARIEKTADFPAFQALMAGVVAEITSGLRENRALAAE
ncbi:N-formylglutamate amidohydrolase [Gemmobacter fulvus]|uniref:N-formylglutamate amidohydrolase n=1 Tax=Gemmobacter fulvus TaxID=2840474 RepID=A0A975P5R9_9RHOB|nr:N-formylglutamate amidohydrolase [Gemmobacter fulvus]MBT9245806.1 N-formylglutamate amidohydrolase [Gemmobacter fulvus]QWK89356.1 N-formylglutamate amidohydrolase [Gemmobacter fulvus]